MIHQDTFKIWGQNEQDNLFKLLPSSLEILHIIDFVEEFSHAILDFAKHLAEGEYPNLQRVSIFSRDPIDDRLRPYYMTGRSFLAFASGQDVLRLEAQSDHPDTDGIDITPYHRLPGEGEEGDADDREPSEDGGLKEDVGTVLNPDDLMCQEEWVWFGRRCLRNTNLMSKLVHWIQEDSKLFIQSSLRDISMRKEIRSLLLGTNVKLECATVYAGQSNHYNRLFDLWDSPPINGRSCWNGGG